MFSKKDFPVDFRLPKNMKTWCALKYFMDGPDRKLLLKIQFEDGTLIQTVLMNNTYSLFDIIAEEDSDEILVDAEKFIAALSKVNASRGVDIEIENKEVHVIDAGTSKMLGILPDISSDISENEIHKMGCDFPVEARHLTEPTELTSLEALYSVHTTCQEKNLNTVLANSHLKIENDSVQFWSTYGGIWHMIKLHTSFSEEPEQILNKTWYISPLWFRNIQYTAKKLNRISIDTNVYGKPYLILTGDSEMERIQIPVYEDECLFSFPKCPNGIQNKKILSLNLRIALRDKKNLIRFVNVPNYYGLCKELRDNCN